MCTPKPRCSHPESLTSTPRFLFAELHFESIKGKMSPKAIQIALSKLTSGSTTYDAAYNIAMSRIEAQSDDGFWLGRL